MAHDEVILVVEDDTDLRDSLCMLLEMEGFQAVGVGNGLEALRYLQAHAPPCVILLDLMMPVMNGGEFRKKQLADPKLAGIPTLVLSAMAAALQKAEVEGAAAYLAKPIAPEDLAETVRRFCCTPPS